MQWITETIYVDVETGSILTKLQVKTAYTVIKTIRENNVKILKDPNSKDTKTIQKQYTKLCRRRARQINLW